MLGIPILSDDPDAIYRRAGRKFGAQPGSSGRGLFSSLAAGHLTQEHTHLGFEGTAILAGAFAKSFDDISVKFSDEDLRHRAPRYHDASIPPAS